MGKVLKVIRNRGFKIVLGLLSFSFFSGILLLVYGYFGASKPELYLPEDKVNKMIVKESGDVYLELRSPWYVLRADTFGEVTVKSLKGETLLSRLVYYSEYEGYSDKWGLGSVSVKLINDTTIQITGKGLAGVLVKQTLVIHNSKPKLDVLIQTLYNSNTTVLREALVAKFDAPVTEIYLKNRKTDNGTSDSEYWIDKQGVRFDSGSSSSLIYHTPQISSMQLDSKNSLLFINLEYFLDHPHINIPYQEDNGGKWRDLSKSIYNTGNLRTDSFSIYFGNLPKAIPRLMMVPRGYLAGYIFTEHADGGTIRSHRAAYFGAENISNSVDATGGFAGHKIPVTKSVFYADNEKSVSGSSIRDDPDYPQLLNFLDQLYETGLYDICLHTPEGLMTNRETLEESIKFMHDRFDAKTWIDHGMYTGRTNRESFVCDGLDPNSEYFAADLWEKYTTSYFWSPAVEMIRENSKVSSKEELRKFRFGNAIVAFWHDYFSPKELLEMDIISAFRELIYRFRFDQQEANSLLHRRGNSYPTPLYWQLPNYSRSFFLWATDFVKSYDGFHGKEADKVLKNELKQINQLINKQGVFINHGYYVREKKGSDIFSETNGALVVNPYFDRMLDSMSRLKDEGDLYITTIKDIMDYWILTENISFEYLPKGIIRLFNNNEEAIKDLSLIVDAKTILVNGKTPSLRKIENETIFWFDIPARKYVDIEVGP